MTHTADPRTSNPYAPDITTGSTPSSGPARPPAETAAPQDASAASPPATAGVAPSRPWRAGAGVGHGAQPVAFAPGAPASYRPLDHVAEADLLTPVVVPRTVAPLPEDESLIRQLASRKLDRPAVVGVIGNDGRAGRTTVTRLLTHVTEHLRGGPAGIAVDGVPVLGRLTAQVDLQGRLTIPDIDQFSWPEHKQWFEMLSFSQGALTLPGAQAGRYLRSMPQQVLAAIGQVSRLAELTFVDTVADVTSPVPAALIEGGGILVLVARATAESIDNAGYVLDFLRQAVPVTDIYARAVVAVRGVQRKWASAALASSTFLSSSVEVVHLPYVRGLDERKPPHELTLAGTRLLAAITTRAAQTTPTAAAAAHQEGTTP